MNCNRILTAGFFCWIIAFLPVALWGQCIFEGNNVPAKPVPQYDEQGDASLWPIDPSTRDIKLRPVDAQIGVTRADMPSKPIAANQDSTEYNSQLCPSESNGWELFMDLAIPGSLTQGASVADWAVVAYGGGLQIWDVTDSGGNIVKGATAAGFAGDWLGFGGCAESHSYLFSVDAVESGSKIFIATAGKTKVGLAIWSFDTGSKQLTQHYQDLNIAAYDVSLLQDPNDNRIYAYATSSKGLRVYDVTAASGLGSGGCLDPDGSLSCGIYRGSVGDIPTAHFVSSAVLNGQTHVAVSDPTDSNLNLEIWEVRNPASPSEVPNGESILRYEGRGTLVHSPELFLYDGNAYLAFVENLVTYVHQVDLDCLGSTSACDPLGSAKVTEDLSIDQDIFVRFHFLDVSFSGEEPFLHHGVESTGTWGTGVERLWELSTLPTTRSRNTLPELTDGGGTYVQDCDNASIDYFGDYYPFNDHGLRNFDPRHALFNGTNLYRAAHGILDVHIRGGIVQTSDPFIATNLDPSNSSIDGGASNEFWLDDPLLYTAAASNCVPQSGQWCWDASTTQADVTFTPTGDFEGCDSSFTDIHQITFACEAAGRCPDASAEVAAWNQACGTPETDGSSQSEANVLLKDPAVEVLSTSGSGTFPQCAQVNLDATVGGRGSASWHWEIEGVDVPDCSGTTPINGDLESADFACVWDTTDIEFSSIFRDGFDTGDCGFWSSAEGLPGCSAGSLVAAETTPTWTPSKVTSLEKADSASFLATLIVDGPANSDVASFNVTIEEVGDPAFTNASNPLSTPAVSGSSATLEAPATDTTTWTWEIEDPEQGTQACSFNAGKSCVVEETSTDSISYLWLGAGTYTYEVSLSNCKSSGSVSATGTVTVEDSATADITNFAISSDEVQSTFNPEGQCCKTDVISSPQEITCPANSVITFDLELAEAGSFTYWMDWDRTDTASSNLVEELPASGSGTTQVTFEHSFSSGLIGTTVFPLSAAGNSVLVDEHGLATKLKIGSCP